MGKCSEILAALSYSVNPRENKDMMMMMMNLGNLDICNSILFSHIFTYLFIYLFVFFFGGCGCRGCALS